MLKKILKDELLIGNFLSNLLCSLSYPTIHYVLIKDVGEKMISLNSIIVCIGGIIFPMFWNKYSDRLYKKYGYLLTLEGILYSLLTIAVIFGAVNNKFYYLADTLLFAVITKNIICGSNKLRALRYKEKEREEYDNNVGIVANVSSLLGFTISFLINLNTNVAFLILGVGLIIDNIFNYKAYKCSIKRLEKQTVKE